MKRLIFAAAMSLIAGTAAHASAVVHVDLIDMGPDTDFSKPLDLGVGGKGDMKMAPVHLKVDKQEIGQGTVKFVVNNKSKDMQHEMIIIPVADPKLPPPFVDKENKIDEDKAAAIGEVSELDPGKTGSKSFTLKPGYYMLFCNIPGHYEDGMWTTIHVK